MRMPEIRFDEKFECVGRWMFGRVNGVGRLTYDPVEGLHLNLSAPVRAMQYEVAAGLRPITVTGVTFQPFRRKVTLFDCYFYGPRARQGTEAQATLVVNRAVFGEHLPNGEIREILSADITLTGINEWASPSLSILDVEPSGPISEAEWYRVSLARSLKKYTIMEEEAKIALSFGMVGRHIGSRVVLEGEGTFTIEPKKPIQLDSLLSEFVRPLENFITFATGKINSLRTFTLSCAADGGEGTSLAILFPPLQAKSRRAQWLFEPRGLFSLLDVSDKLEAHLSAWLKLYRRYRSVCDLLFHTLYNDQYLEARFLWLVQIIEGYHRLRTDLRQFQLPANEYDALKANIMASVGPADHRRVIKHALRYANDVSLPTRLHELTTRFAHLIPDVLLPEERKHFPQHCAKIRNAMAHHLPGERGDEAENLYRYSEFILRLLIVGLMLETGFSEAAVRRALLRGASISPEQALPTT